MSTTTSSTSSAETSFEDVAVQPLHQGNIRKPWHKKILQEYVSLEAKSLIFHRGNYSSPTDNMLSPCTKKLQAHKKRHYNKFARSLLLADAFRSKPQLLARTLNTIVNSKYDTTEHSDENKPPLSV
jgi:Spo12 family